MKKERRGGDGAYDANGTGHLSIANGQWSLSSIGHSVASFVEGGGKRGQNPNRWGSEVDDVTVDEEEG